MATQITPAKFAVAAAVALPAIILAKHALQVYSRMAAAPRRSITEVDVNPESFLQSDTMTRLVNPRNHIALHDCRHIDVHIPEGAQDIGDEAILAAFMRGFFGGKVFAPERALLKMAGRELVNYPSLKKNESNAPIWNVEQLEGDALPSVRSVYFGAFQISAIHIHELQGTAASGTESESNIDLVFGSSEGNFGGSHQFSVLRTKKDPSSVRIRYAHSSCNPTINKQLKPDFIGPLHNFYAMVLFREAVGQVKLRFGQKCL
ncbi:hypothetical protein ACHAQA_006116 [Verticillium albo-atrum]